MKLSEDFGSKLGQCARRQTGVGNDDVWRPETPDEIFHRRPQRRRIADIQRIGRVASAEGLIEGFEKYGPPRHQTEGRAVASVVNGECLADSRRCARDEYLQRQLFLAGFLAARLGDQLVSVGQYFVEAAAADQVFAVDRHRRHTLNLVGLRQLVTALDLAHDAE